MRLGTWNVRSLYRAGSLTGAARELARCKLDLMGVQEVRWEKGGPCKSRRYFLYGKGKENHQFGRVFIENHRIVSTIKRVQSVSGRGHILF